MGFFFLRFYLPFQAVHLILHREVQAYLHHLLAAHLESIDIVFCLYLSESLLGTFVEFQLHHVDGICSLHRDIDSALRRMLLHEDIIVGEQGEHDVERLLPMPLVVGVVAVRHRLQEVVQQVEG